MKKESNTILLAVPVGYWLQRFFSRNGERRITADEAIARNRAGLEARGMRVGARYEPRVNRKPPFWEREKGEKGEKGNE